MKISNYRNRSIILFSDILLLAFSWYFAYLLRFNFMIPEWNQTSLISILPFMIVIKLIVFYFCDLYRGMWRYTSIEDLLNIIKAASIGSLLVVAFVLFSRGFAGLSRSIFVLDWGITIVCIAGLRISIRILFWSVTKKGASRRNPLALFLKEHGKIEGTKKLLIVGAGESGEKIYREIRYSAWLHYKVIGFVDDDPNKTGLKIHGLPVLGNTRELEKTAKKVHADEILIAIPSASDTEMRDIVSRCKNTGIPFKTLPTVGELIDGKVSMSAVRDVAIIDLLGRSVVHLEEDRIFDFIKESHILVTGAGGSIGSELCRQICRYNPATLILFERAETPLYELELELKNSFPKTDIVPVLGDIRDRKQLFEAFYTHKPRIVFHAAAYKHVPMMERQPWKSVKNNILGTRNVIDMARDCAVERVVHVSTDKAVRPTSVMGATKRVAEYLVQCANDDTLEGTKFMTVRFGNVIGSAGSVVPLFKKQIQRGGPVTVTHADVKRYFMTITEACQLILQAMAMGNGGEIFVLNMGSPVKIDDMARDLIRLSGLEPDRDIQIKYIGLRPGEKLFEELVTEGEGITPTGHEKIVALRGKDCDPNVLNGRIDTLARLAYDQDTGRIISALQNMVPEYNPSIGKNILPNKKPTPQPTLLHTPPHDKTFH